MLSATTTPAAIPHPMAPLPATTHEPASSPTTHALTMMISVNELPKRWLKFR